jgi:predicted transposase YbfD/YdcC
MSSPAAPEMTTTRLASGWSCAANVSVSLEVDFRRDASRVRRAARRRDAEK